MLTAVGIMGSTQGIFILYMSNDVLRRLHRKNTFSGKLSQACFVKTIP
jgi:hypothetical protein